MPYAPAAGITSFLSNNLAHQVEILKQKTWSTDKDTKLTQSKEELSETMKYLKQWTILHNEKMSHDHYIDCPVTHFRDFASLIHLYWLTVYLWTNRRLPKQKIDMSTLQSSQLVLLMVACIVVGGAALSCYSCAEFVLTEGKLGVYSDNRYRLSEHWPDRV